MMRAPWQLKLVTIAVLLLAGAAAFAAALASGGASAANLSGDQSVAPVNYSSTYGWTPTVPSSASTPAAIVSAIGNAAGLGNGLRVSLANPPAQATRQGSSLSFDVATDGSLAGNTHATWTAEIVQGVIAEAFVARGMP